MRRGQVTTVERVRPGDRLRLRWPGERYAGEMSRHPWLEVCPEGVVQIGPMVKVLAYGPNGPVLSEMLHVGTPCRVERDAG